MAVAFSNKNLLMDNSGKILKSVSGDILYFSLSNLLHTRENVDIEFIMFLLSQPIIVPKIRLSVLNPDETVNYVIPEEDVVFNGINYNENYTNGQRRSLSIKLINVKEDRGFWDYKYNTITQTMDKYWHITQDYKYVPNVNGLWYGTKIKYETGIEYQNEEYFFERGIFIVENFDFQYNNQAKDITYSLTDKFGLFDGTTGVLESGYEIPVGTPIDEAIDGLLNLSCTDGYINDQKICIIDSKYINFKTQATIRVDEGGKIADIYEQLATQMSAEYFYNSSGHLVFYPIDESMNDNMKPIIWLYDELQTNGLQFRAEEEIVNIVKVVGTNVDGKIYTAIAKNDNLSSPINIYYIKERRTTPIENANVWSDDMAQELADFHLRNKSILTLKQQIEVPYNPMLIVNTVVELENKELAMKREKYIIKSISYTSGSATMSIEIANLDNLPLIGGLLS